MHYSSREDVCPEGDGQKGMSDHLPVRLHLGAKPSGEKPCRGVPRWVARLPSFAANVADLSGREGISGFQEPFLRSSHSNEYSSWPPLSPKLLPGPQTVTRPTPGCTGFLRTRMRPGFLTMFFSRKCAACSLAGVNSSMLIACVCLTL